MFAVFIPQGLFFATAAVAVNAMRFIQMEPRGHILVWKITKTVAAIASEFAASSCEREAMPRCDVAMQRSALHCEKDTRYRTRTKSLPIISDSAVVTNRLVCVVWEIALHGTHCRSVARPVHSIVATTCLRDPGRGSVLGDHNW